jgi:hypothetical protein
MSFQTFLLILIAAMVGIHWYPDIAYPAIFIALIAIQGAAQVVETTTNQYGQAKAVRC